MVRGQLRRVITQGVIAGGRRRVEAHLQVAEVAQRTDDAPTDLLDCGHIPTAGGARTALLAAAGAAGGGKGRLIFLYSALPVQAWINGTGHCINGEWQIEKLHYMGRRLCRIGNRLMVVHG